jgi:hypothetical protein
MVPTPWRAPRLETTSLSASTNMDMRGGTLEELMRSRESMKGIMSRDLFSGVTLAIGGTVTAAIWCLGLAVRETAAYVKELETMLHRIGAATHLSHLGKGVVLLPHSMRYLCHPRLCAAHIPCSSCAPEDEERPLLGWLPIMLQSLHCARK